VLEKHGEDEKKIEGMAQEHDIEVNTEMDLEYVFKEYCKAFPKIMHHWLLKQFTQGLKKERGQKERQKNGVRSLIYDSR